jgi:cytochrome c-type biogenesis protein CcmH/NrfG
MGEPEDKGYTVEDRRYLHMSEEEKTKVRAEEAKRTTKEAAAEEAFQEASQKATAAAGQTEEHARLPEITFASLLVSLSSTAFISLGSVPDPESGKTEKNLALAKQTIDLLGMLREKTRNNLTLEEDNLFDHLLHDLRMAYVREVG